MRFQIQTRILANHKVDIRISFDIHFLFSPLQPYPVPIAPEISLVSVSPAMIYTLSVPKPGKEDSSRPNASV